MIKLYQVSRRYMLFMHNNKYLPLIVLLTLLQWTIHNTACIVLHPANYFDIYGVKWLKQANQARRPAELGSCSMHKWMKGNVWRRNNVKRVSVKPEKHREIFKIFHKYFMKLFRGKKFHEILHHYLGPTCCVPDALIHAPNIFDNVGLYPTVNETKPNFSRLNIEACDRRKNGRSWRIRRS